MMELFLAVSASLFSVVNPIGAIPVFLSMTTEDSFHERKSSALHTAIYFALILLAFYFAGNVILSFFGVSLNALRIAGGLVILNSGYSLLSGQIAKGRAVDKEVRAEAMAKEDISFAPMAMPMLSGPGSISYLISLYGEYPDSNSRLVIAGVIVFLALIIFIMLRFSPMLFEKLGVTGIKAISRIMGFIVMAIGIQFIIIGIVDLVKSIL
ncbi:MAG: MarC family NAAT transporter [Bacteroidia bacterium]|nr:MarC family NAAT transporter [Bacteroidia bacterium]